MSPANGHADGSESCHDIGAAQLVTTSVASARSAAPQCAPERIKDLVAQLEIPFDPMVIEWRVTNTTKNGKPRGQVIPYTDQRAYTDRLNTLLTPAGWTRKYTVHTSANFERSKDQKTAAKVFVTCELTIFDLGTHAATGEEWADDDNAGTSAEAQAFKRACSCFGLGRYLYYFSGDWVDVDERKRPKSIPRLPQWATPAGWRQGQRPQREGGANQSRPEPTPNDAKRRQSQKGDDDAGALVLAIETLHGSLGNGIYRGLLKTIARAWKASQIQDIGLLQKVLTYMQAAERGLRRLDDAVSLTGPEAINPILRSLKLRSLHQVDSLETLKQIVLALEETAGRVKR